MFWAVQQIVGLHIRLEEYKVEAVSGGSDAQGEVVVRVKDVDSNVDYRGRATSTDVLEATLMAFVDASNRIQRANEKKSQ